VTDVGYLYIQETGGVQLFRSSKNCPRMEPEGSLPRAQGPATLVICNPHYFILRSNS